MVRQQQQQQQGFTLVEVIIASAITVVLFGALLYGTQAMIKLVVATRAQTTATTVAMSQMEYIRSFTYDEVGTIGGIVPGPIPQNSTTTENGVTYAVRTSVRLVDDPADGFAGADSNSITADYKKVRVEVSWDVAGVADTVSFSSNVVPPGMETLSGAGTIKVNVFDAAVQPVAGAGVRFVNNVATSAIDTVYYTNPEGVVYLPGAPAVPGYNIDVSLSGYSRDGTYVASSTNPNPTTLPVAVSEGLISTMNFQIDRLSTLQLQAQESPTFAGLNDSFATGSNISQLASTTLTSGNIVLEQTAGVYEPAGEVWSTSTGALSLQNWHSASVVASTTAGTDVRFRVTEPDGSGGMQLVSDSVLPGNSTGFINVVDLRDVSTSTHPALGLMAELTTTQATQTPELLEWSVVGVVANNPVSGVDFALTGAKTIGTDDSGQPVYKQRYTGTTDADGMWLEPAVEFDQYTLELLSGSYDVYEQCPASPFAIDPDETAPVTVTLGPPTAQQLLVSVTEADGTPIPGAVVRLQNTGVDEEAYTSLCGQVYFGSGLYADDDYQLTVSAAGFGDKTFASTTVHASATFPVTF